MYETTTSLDRQELSDVLSPLLALAAEEESKISRQVSCMFAECYHGRLPHRVAQVLAELDAERTCEEIAVLMGENKRMVHGALRAVARRAPGVGAVLVTNGSFKQKTYRLLDEDEVVEAEEVCSEIRRNIPVEDLLEEYEYEVSLQDSLPEGAEGIVNNASFLNLKESDMQILHFLLNERRNGNAVRIGTMVAELGVTFRQYRDLRIKLNKNALYTGFYLHKIGRDETGYTAISFLDVEQRRVSLEELNPEQDIAVYFDKARAFSGEDARKWLAENKFSAYQLSVEEQELFLAVIEGQISSRHISISSLARGDVLPSHKGIGRHKRIDLIEGVLARAYEQRNLRFGYVRVTQNNKLEFVQLGEQEFQQPKTNKEQVKFDGEELCSAVSRSMPVEEVLGEYSCDVGLQDSLPDEAERIVNNASFLGLKESDLKMLHFLLNERRSGNAVRIGFMFAELGVSGHDYEALRAKLNKHALYTGFYLHKTGGDQTGYTAISFLNLEERGEALKELHPKKDLTCYFDEAQVFSEAGAREWLREARLSPKEHKLFVAVIEGQVKSKHVSVERLVGEGVGIPPSRLSMDYLERVDFINQLIDRSYKNRGLRGGYLRVMQNNELEFVRLYKPDLKVGRSKLLLEEEHELLHFARSKGVYAKVAQDRLIEGHMGFIKTIAKEFVCELSFEDRVSVCMEVVMKAIMPGRFDPKAGFKSKKYLRNGMRRAIACANRQAAIVVRAKYTTRGFTMLQGFEDELRKKGFDEREITDKALSEAWGVDVEAIRLIRKNNEIRACSVTTEEGDEQQMSSDLEGNLPDSLYDRRGFSEKVKIFLAQFPEHKRVCVERRFWGEIGAGELAKHYSRSTSAIDQWQQEVLRAMRKDPVISQMVAELMGD